MSTTWRSSWTAPFAKADDSLPARGRLYFFSDPCRSTQTVLGLLWLLDGGLQFQSFMYSSGFIQMLTGTAVGQPRWLQESMRWAAQTAGAHLAVLNSMFALIQVSIGLGLLYRRTVRPALELSFVWALIVWSLGEGFGMLFTSMASPLTGAPGAASLYALVGAMSWPTPQPGGLLGVRGARLAWAALWALMGWLWLETPTTGPYAISSLIKASPSGVSWLSSLHGWAATATMGSGFAIAPVLSGVSVAIGLAVAADWHPKPFLALAAVLSIAYWLLGQGLGGLFEGDATDPNAGPLFVLLAYTLYTLTPFRVRLNVRPTGRLPPQGRAARRTVGGARRRRPPVYVAAMVGAVAAVAAAVAIVGASGASRHGGAPSSPDTVSVGFCQAMILHHQQAVTMSNIVEQAPGASPEVKALAGTIAQVQLQQMGIMQGWLELWDEPLSPSGNPMQWMDPAPRSSAAPKMVMDRHRDRGAKHPAQ